MLCRSCTLAWSQCRLRRGDVSSATADKLCVHTLWLKIYHKGKDLVE
jgi:hypothetical protein